MVVTDTMHTRKTRLYEEADAFLVMPGGLGTFDEAFEIITWRQLRLHDKPIILCNVVGSVDPLVATIEHAIEQGFADPACRRLFEVIEGVPAVLERLNTLRRGPKAMRNDVACRRPRGNPRRPHAIELTVLGGDPVQQLAKISPAQHADQRVRGVFQSVDHVLPIHKAAIGDQRLRHRAPLGDTRRPIRDDEALDQHTLATTKPRLGPGGMVFSLYCETIPHMATRANGVQLVEHRGLHRAADVLEVTVDPIRARSWSSRRRSSERWSTQSSNPRLSWPRGTSRSRRRCRRHEHRPAWQAVRQPILPLRTRRRRRMSPRP